MPSESPAPDKAADFRGFSLGPQARAVGVRRYVAEAVENRPHAGGEGVGRLPLPLARDRPRLGQARIAKRHAARFHSGKSDLGSLRDQRQFFLGDAGVNAEHERVDLGAELGDDEIDLARHQARNERDVSAEAIELGNDDGTAERLRSIERRRLRPAVLLQSEESRPHNI